jgi:hypothetical protein
VPEHATLVYCEYPFSVRRVGRDRVVLQVYGDGRLDCRLRVLALDGGTPALDHVTGSVSGRVDATKAGAGWCDFTIHPGQDITITVS